MHFACVRGTFDADTSSCPISPRSAPIVVITAAIVANAWRSVIGLIATVLMASAELIHVTD